MIKYPNSEKMKRVLLLAIVILSTSFTLLITLKMKPNISPPTIENNNDWAKEETVHEDPLINSDVEIFNLPLINTDIRNVLLVVDEGETAQFKTAGFYVLSIDLSTNTFKTVSIYPHMSVTAFGRENLILSDVREQHGINCTVNIINNQFKLDINKYIMMEYSDLSEIFNILNLKNTVEISNAYNVDNVNNLLKEYNIKLTQSDIVTEFFAQDENSSQAFERFKSLTQMLRNMFHQVKESTFIQVSMFDKIKQIYGLTETNLQEPLFHRFMLKTTSPDTKSESLLLPLIEREEYFELNMKTLNLDTKSRLSIRGFLYED